MGFLKSLFKKKPGGTFIGNMFRRLEAAYTFNIFGNPNAGKENNQ